MSLPPYFFVDDVPEELLCAVCAGVIVQPYCCQEGHDICSMCLDQWKLKNSGSAPCPVCSVCEVSTRNRTLESLIKRLHIRCPHSFPIESECPWEGTLGQLDAHTAECSVVVIECEECHLQVRRADLPYHKANTCLERIVACSDCDGRVRVSGMAEHVPACPARPRSCLHCGATMPQCAMEEHVSTDCPDAPVPCPHSHLYCKDRPKRRDLAAHAADWAVHTACLLDRIYSLEKKVQDLECDRGVIIGELAWVVRPCEVESVLHGKRVVSVCAPGVPQLYLSLRGNASDGCAGVFVHCNGGREVDISGTRVQCCAQAREFCSGSVINSRTGRGWANMLSFSELASAEEVRVLVVYRVKRASVVMKTA